MKKRFLASATAFALILSLLPVASLGAEAPPAEAPPAENSSVATTVEDAILYPSEESGSLDYNVVYTSEYDSEVKILDSSNSGFDIDTVEELETVMGVADAPKVQLGTSTGLRTLGYAVTANLGFDEDGDIAQIEITDVNERPIVGISWKKDNIGSDYQGFAEAFERNGAYAVYLPQVHDADEAREVLSQIDGIFMTGGEDWNPDRYDQEQTPHGSRGWNDARDTSDINLMQQAIEMDVPLLTVCRGTQGLNVALGGGLIQDVPYYLGQRIQNDEEYRNNHTYEVQNDTGYQKWNSETQSFEIYSCGEDSHLLVTVDELTHGGSTYHKLAPGADGFGISKENSKWLYKIIGSDSIDLVATAHHQAVDPTDLGDGLTVVAMSSDGIVEAIEHKDSLFALGVQWHPERDALEDTKKYDDGTPIDVDQNKCNALLKALVDYASRYADSVELTFEYPTDVSAEDVLINVYQGIPLWYTKYSASTVEELADVLSEQLEEITPTADGTYLLNETGGYCYFVRGKEAGEYYNIVKFFIVDENDLSADTITLPVKTGPIAGTGYESGNNNPIGVNGERAPEGFDQGLQHLVPFEGTDEMEPLLGTDGLKGYEPFTTPAFQEGRPMYQATTQDEMMKFIAEYEAACEYMHVYSMGTTSNLGYDYPLIVFTKKDIPADATMDEAAEILKGGGLPIVWQQAQIHPYEPAAGESALVMIQELCGEYGETILDGVDIVMVPRVNVEGSFLFWRGDYNGVDMNRDHMVVSSEQNAMLHDAYYKFMPHVVIDNHEFFFSEMGNYNGDPEKFLLNDFQITGATSLNDDPTITDLTTNVIVDKMHKDLLDTGFRAYHYGITSNNPIGRAYYGLGNAISVLIESHGADGALFAMPRRVYGQVVATKSVFESTIENADVIVEAVNNARADVIEKGRTYEEDDVLVLKQSASGAITSPTPLDEYVADIYGNITSIGKNTIDLQDTIDRSRPRPTAYIVDASEPWVDDLLYILKHHNTEYFELEKGTEVEVQQYYFVEDDGAKSCIADLRAPETVEFEDGAIMIPMDQAVGNIIGMLMEPDVGDSSSYNGTLYQYGLITYDTETMNMPLYRYTGDNPREALLDDGHSSGGGSSGGGSSSGNNGSQTEEPDEPSGTQDENVFSDVSSSAWYAEAVNYVYENGLMTGISSTQFAPNNTLTRAMVVQTLYAMANKPAVSGSENFTDVSSGDWFADAVTWASANGIVSGYNATQFAPNDPLTREQLALILYGYAQMRGYNTTQSGTSIQKFTDYGSISAWALEAMDWAVNAGLLSGKGNGVLDPTGTATRAEVAQILMNFSETVVG